MEALESAVLARLDVPDPYLPRPGPAPPAREGMQGPDC